MIEAKIGMLGAGNMAGALIRGLLVSKAAAPSQVRASDVRPARLKELSELHGIQTTLDNLELVSGSDLVVCAVKPQVLSTALKPVSEALSGKLLVSIAAGVPTSAIAAAVPSGVRIVRAMPNTPALVLAGMTAIAKGPGATDQDLVLAKQLFDAVGKTVVVDESLMDAVTGLSGSGPAYVMLIIEALSDGGVRAGLPRDVALLLAAQTVLGSAQLHLETGDHPGKLKDMVTSPGGTTIAGVFALERGSLRHTLMDAVGAATDRARELGKAAQSR